MTVKTKPREKSGSVPVVCQFCGDQFKTYQCYINDGRGKYCSSKCGYASTRKYPDGYKRCSRCKQILGKTNFGINNHHHDGLSTECRPCAKQINIKMTIGKKQAFISSRGNLCAKCGVYNPDHRFFDIDHIIPVFVSGKKRVQYNYSNPDELQILCPNCHRLKTIVDRKWAKYDL